jgi:hypothetical protein
MILKRRNAELISRIPFNENINLTADNNATTSIVGISIHLLSRGRRSAISNKIPQDNAITDVRPIGYSISVKPILSGINTKIAIAKSAMAADQ